VARSQRHRRDGAAVRGAATLLFCVFATGAGAQISGTASIVSDYRYRGITLSDQKPAAQIGLTYDGPSGWYAGAFGSTVRLAAPAGPGVQGTAFAGYAARLAGGISIDVGGDYSTFTGAGGYSYGELYLGVARENFSARIYYSNRYFGQRVNAWYGELNAAQPLIDRFSLLAHVGFLSSRSDYPYTPQVNQHVVDGRIGIGADFDLFHVELAWIGISTAYVAYGVTGSSSPNTVVLTVSRQF